jgi:hypothetical protein
MSLSERFEGAYQQFSTTFFTKVRLHRAGLRPYSSEEFREDLYGIARAYALCGESLWCYFRMLHPGPMLGKPLKRSPFKFSEVKRSVEEEMDDPERLRRTRGAVLGIAIILTLFGLIMLAPALYWAALSHWHEAIPLLLIGPVACIFAFNFYVTWLRLRQRDGDE